MANNRAVTKRYETVRTTLENKRTKAQHVIENATEAKVAMAMEMWADLTGAARKDIIIASEEVKVEIYRMSAEEFKKAATLVVGTGVEESEEA